MVVSGSGDVDGEEGKKRRWCINLERYSGGEKKQRTRKEEGSK